MEIVEYVPLCPEPKLEEEVAPMMTEVQPNQGLEVQTLVVVEIGSWKINRWHRGTTK